MKHLFELIPDVTGHDEQAHVFDPSAGGTGASARNHGENQQHPGKRRPKVVIIRSKSTGRMSSSYPKQGFTERGLGCSESFKNRAAVMSKVRMPTDFRNQRNSSSFHKLRKLPRMAAT